MRKALLTLIGIISLSGSFGQKVINNTKTENHRQIAGTKYFMIAPEGFTPALNFNGFQEQVSGSSILLVEIPGPFAEISKGITNDNLKTKGVIIKKRKEIKINGIDAILFTAEQFAYGTNYKKFMLVFGDSTMTTMINGIFSEELKEIGDDILESMLSVAYDAALEVDPLSASLFSVNTENTKLKFAGNLAGMLMFDPDGKLPTESDDKTFFIVGTSLSNSEVVDRKQNAINRIKSMPQTEISVRDDKILPVEIDGIRGYEIVAEGLDKSGNKEMIYQVMLYTDSGYYIMLGTCQDEFDLNLELFKQVARSFKRK